MPHVLLVDDDHALLEALPEAVRLRLPAVVVDVADSAAEARVRLRSADYDAVVCDIKMPGTDGLTLLAEIREACPDTPTLMITGHGEHDLAVQALRGGAYDFIQKPIDRDYFQASLSRAIQVKGLRRNLQLQKAVLARYTQGLEEMVQDRTRELRELTEALEQRVEERTVALRRNERLATAGQTAAAAAHEIRNPLAAIKGFLQLALRRPEYARDECLRRCLAETARIEGLLRDFLLLAKPQGLHIDRLPLTALLRDVCDVLLVRRAERDIAVRLCADPDLALLGDEAKLRQVLLNIGSNALEALGERGGEVCFFARRSFPRPGRLEIRVWNNGPSIPEQEIERIFEPFYSTKERGTGLGLAICRRIILDHGGEIAAGNPEGGGADFRITLPDGVGEADAPPGTEADGFPGAPSAREGGMSTNHVGALDTWFSRYRPVADPLPAAGHEGAQHHVSVLADVLQPAVDGDGSNPSAPPSIDG